MTNISDYYNQTTYRDAAIEAKRRNDLELREVAAWETLHPNSNLRKSPRLVTADDVLAEKYGRRL